MEGQEQAPAGWPSQQPILQAFGRVDVLDSFDPKRQQIQVEHGGRIVAIISPARRGFMEMAYVYPHMAPIGPAYDPDQMRKRLVHRLFAGDEDAFAEARITLARI